MELEKGVVVERTYINYKLYILYLARLVKHGFQLEIDV